MGGLEHLLLYAGVSQFVKSAVFTMRQNSRHLLSTLTALEHLAAGFAVDSNLLGGNYLKKILIGISCIWWEREDFPT